MKIRRYITFCIAICLLGISSKPAYSGSNRDDVQKSLKDGWGEISWGKHINHIEYVKAAPCFLDPTGSCISSYISSILTETAILFGKDLVLEAFENPSQLFGAGKFEIQAGVASFEHWSRENPCSVVGGDCWTPKIPNPNTHQPYLRWRRKDSGTDVASLKNFVTKAYNDCLGRDPESDAVITDWSNQAKVGGLNSARSGICNSKEAENKTKKEVWLAYNNYLRRDPESKAVVTNWQNFAKNSGIIAMQNGIRNSPEALEIIKNDVRLAYNDCLGREPESDAVITNWQNFALQNGTTKMRSSICNSPAATSSLNKELFEYPKIDGVNLAGVNSPLEENANQANRFCKFKGYKRQDGYEIFQGSDSGEVIFFNDGRWKKSTSNLRLISIVCTD